MLMHIFFNKSSRTMLPFWCIAILYHTLHYQQKVIQPGTRFISAFSNAILHRMFLDMFFRFSFVSVLWNWVLYLYFVVLWAFSSGRVKNSFVIVCCKTNQSNDGKHLSYTYSSWRNIQAYMNKEIGRKNETHTQTEIEIGKPAVKRRKLVTWLWTAKETYK